MLIKKNLKVLFRRFILLQELRNSIPKPDYIQFLKEVIIGEENPENVILLRIFPEEQKTKIDFILLKNTLA